MFFDPDSAFWFVGPKSQVGGQKKPFPQGGACSKTSFFCRCSEKRRRTATCFCLWFACSEKKRTNNTTVYKLLKARSSRHPVAPTRISPAARPAPATASCWRRDPWTGPVGTAEPPERGGRRSAFQTIQVRPGVQANECTQPRTLGLTPEVVVQVYLLSSHLGSSKSADIHGTRKLAQKGIPLDILWICGWTKFCTTLKPRGTVVCWYLQGNRIRSQGF